jgi:hypothetical protein
MTRSLPRLFVQTRRVLAYLILNHISLQQLARRVPIWSLGDLRVENATLIFDEVVRRRLSMDGEVGGLALAELVTLLLHGSDIVGAVAGLGGAFGEEGGVWICVTSGVGWWVG